MRNIPITKTCFDQREMELLQNCLDSGWVTQGPMTEKFEQLFMDRHKSKYAIAVSSCTAALHLAMLVLGIKEGDEVIVPAFTWITSANCIEYVGAKAVFVDVEKNSFNINPQLIEAAITKKTKAIIAVHLFGYAAKMDEIMEIAKKHNLRVIEDCACAIGTTYKGTPVGTIGDIGCFSFHPRKAITTGEGGLCSTNNEKLAYLLAQYRNHGAKVEKSDEYYGKPYYMGRFDVLGYNLRLSDIQAAVGVAQYEKLDSLLMRRRECALYYLDKLKNNTEYLLPEMKNEYGHTFQSFVILDQKGHKHRNSIMDKLTSGNIQSRPGTLAVHRLDYYKNKYKIKNEDFPISCECEDTSITLPIYWDMTHEEQDKVIGILTERHSK